MAIARRIEHDPGVSSPPSDFASDERHRIVDNPADGRLGQARQRGVAARPGDRGPRRVDMDDPGAAGRTGQAGRAGMGEQVEDLWRGCHGACGRVGRAISHVVAGGAGRATARAPGPADRPRSQPAPDRDLLREHANLAGRCQTDLERQAIEADEPRWQ